MSILPSTQRVGNCPALILLLALLAIFILPCAVLAVDCSPAAPGLIGWWPGDGNANNALGTNHGTLQGGANASATGLVGSAFNFDGTNGYVQIANSTVLQPTNLTIEAWVKFASLDSAGSGGSPAGDQYLVFKQNPRTSDFEGFDLSKTRVSGSDYFRFVVASATGQSALIRSVSTISTGVWYHVAAVRGPSVVQLYVNGVLERQTNLAFAQSYGNFPLYFGTSGQPAWDHKLKGNLDEVALYNRALSSNEVVAVYLAGAAGKCKAPTITLPPQSQTGVVGSTAAFSVAATGFGTLNYQWWFNGSPLAGATNSSLALSNVQLASQGTYSVIVSNTLGSVASSIALLTIVAPQPGVPYITGVSPGVGAPGASVNISGFNFSPVATNNIVYFGAVRANVAAAGSNYLTVAVPVGATYAPVSVTVNGLAGVAKSAFLPTFTGNGQPVSAGTFAPRQDLSVGYGNFQSVIADFDGDGKPDVGVGNGYYHTLSLFRNIGAPGSLAAGSFAPPVVLPIVGSADGASGLIAVDVDNDGRPDLVFTDPANNRVGIFRNTAVPGSLATNSFAEPVYFVTGDNPKYVRAQDLDGDGRLDLVTCNFNGNNISVFRNLSTPGGLNTNSFAAAVNLATATGPQDVTIADLNGDGKPDLAVTHYGAAILSLYQNLSSAGDLNTNSFASRVDLSALSSHITTIAGDVDGDGKPDLLAGGLNNTLSVYRNVTGPGALTVASFAPPVDFSAPGWIHNLALSDMNGDGLPDVIMVGELNSYLAIFQNQSTPGSFTTGSLAARVDFGTGWNAWGVSVGDLDGDGRADVFICNDYETFGSLYQNVTPFGGPPFISAQPAGQSATEGNSATFTVAAGGQVPLNYQWFFNGAPLTDTARISGVKTNSLIIANLALADTGNYSVVITNSLGSVTSSVVALTVNPALCSAAPPGLVGWWPGDGNALDSGSGNHGILQGGLGFVPGRVGQAMNFDGIDDGVFVAASTNLAVQNLTIEGWVNPSDVSIPRPIAEFADPTGLTAVNLWLGTSPAGGPSAYPGGLYGLIRGQGGSAVQVGTVVDALPANQWSHVALTYDITARILRVYLNGANVGATTSSVPVIPQTFLPVYLGYRSPTSGELLADRRYVGAIDELSIYSRVLSVEEIQAIYNSGVAGKCLRPPAFTQPLSDILVAAGNSVVVVAPLTGSQPMSQQWFFQGLPLADNAHVAGATSNILVIANAQPNDMGGYFLVASNSVGVSTSSVAQLIVGVPPGVVQAPASQTNTTGLPATFTVVANGDAPLGYQWRFNGNNLSNNNRISGATNNSLTISNLVIGDVGSYDVVITNGFGSVTSIVATLTLLNAPVITGQPVSRLIVPGLPTTFSATVTGDAPLAYQWQFNGADILDATNITYTIPAVNVTNLGAYRLIASNPVAVRVSADALLRQGNIAAWGRNDIGQTVVPLSATNVIALACGITSFVTDHTLALRADGTVIAWGNNSNGQTNVPATLSNVVAIAAGGTHSLALRADGTVVAWGNNGNGQLNVPATLSNVIAIAAGGAHSLALRADGRVIAWGYNVYGQSTVPLNLGRVVAIATGLNHSLALRSDGVAFNWGLAIDRTSQASAAIGTFSVPEVKGIAGGNSHSTFLRSNGTVTVIGSNTFGQTNVPASLTNAVAVAAGDYYTMAVRDDGTLAVWGRNDFTQTNIPPGVSNVVAITAGGTDALALLSDGRPLIAQPPVGGVNFLGREQTFRATVTGAAPLKLQWQFNNVDLANATNATLVVSNLSLANSGNFRLVASNALGFAVSVAVPLTVLDQTNLLVLSQPPQVQTNYLGAKVLLSAAVVGNGPLQYQWKFNDTDLAGATNQDLIFDPILLTDAGNYAVAISNQSGGIVSLASTQRVFMVRSWGLLTDNAANTPLTLTNVVAVAAGYAGSGTTASGHFLALRSEGKVVTWGSTVGTISNVPAILTNSITTAIAGGLNSSIALRSDGTPVTWGSTVYSQSNAPANASGLTAIAAGDNHFLGLRSDGTVVAWGLNTAGQANVPASATNIVSIAAGTTHSLALRANGTVVAWGLGTAGQTNVPATLTNAIAISAGNQFSAALRADGTVVQWGTGLANYPVPTGLSNIVAIAAGYTHLLALRADGVLVSWGFYFQTPKESVTPVDLVSIIQISAIGDRDVALLGTRAPAITIQPFDRALLRGSNTTFNARSVSPVASTFQWRHNGVDIPFATNATLSLTNLQLAQSGAYQLVVSNSYGSAVTRNAKLSVTLPLAEALDTTNVAWQSTNSIPWFGQTAVSHDGVDATRSGSITHGQETLLQTTLSGPAQLSFWWKVSSEASFDTLEFKLDGLTQATISGEVDWEQRSYGLAPGAHILQWRYAKDPSSSAGQDAGWVDQFVYSPDAPMITVQPVGQTVNAGANVQFNVSATGVTPFSYQWLKNGTNAGLPNNPTVTLNAVGRAARGTYAVVVSNSGGSSLSSNAVLQVLVPQRFGAPVLLPNGSVRFPAGDADGGLLSAADLAQFEVQASTNLVNWETLPNVLSLTNGMLLLQDPAQTNHPARFYRIRE